MGNRLYRSDRRICAEGEAEYSLCGDALEGDESNDIAPIVNSWVRGPITCPGCCAVIKNIRHNYARVRLEPMEAN